LAKVSNSIKLKKSEKSLARQKHGLRCIGAKFCKNKKWLVIAKLAKFTMVQGANKNTKGKVEIVVEILPDRPPLPHTFAIGYH
jgi:hypothetical protein